MGCCLKFLGSLNLIIGLVGIIVQIVALINSDGNLIPGNPLPPYDIGDHYGVGIWSGVLFLLTGFGAFKYATLPKYSSNETVWKAVVIVLSILSFCCGIALIAIAGVKLDTFSDLGECIIHPTNCTCDQIFQGNFCSTQTIYNAIFISVGAAALLINPFLVLFSFCSCCRQGSSQQTV